MSNNRSVHDTHVTLKTLPSRGVPYAPDTKISLRALKLGEVDYVFEHKDKVTDIVKYISERDIIRGIPVPELTVDDWEFIELTLVSMTFPGAKFDLHGGACPGCGDKIKVIELKDDDDRLIKTIEVKPELKAVLLPKDISFHTLDDMVDWPIEADLSVGPTQIDFLRLKHYLELSDKGIQQKDWTPLHLSEKMCGYDAEDLAYADGMVLNYIKEKLFHGVLNQFDITCNVCGTVYPISTAWEVADFIPFWQGGRPEGDRVRFGSGGTPGRNESA